MATILDFQIHPLSAETYSLAVSERHLNQLPVSEPLVSTAFNHRIDFLTDFSVDRLNASTKDAAERFDELQKLGQELYQKLFPSTVEQVWNKYKQRNEFLILCLRFAPGATKLEVLPWETLHDGTEFIAAGSKTTLTRLPLDIAFPNDLLPIPRPLKLFGFFSSPLDLQDYERLNAEREQEILLEAINDPAGQGHISADFEDEAKLEILERSLRDSYHILHFTGHGISPHDGGGLLLEDEHGKKRHTSVDEVMQAVKSGVGNLRLAVISGCQTARTLHSGAFNDLSRELLRQQVPAVIAMQFSISDEGGLKFAEALYKAISKGVELECAVHTARRVLLDDKRFFINNDALAVVLLTANGACLQTMEVEAARWQDKMSALYLGDKLDPLARGFYGRRREYRQIRDGLLHKNQTAIIIHGIGGIGKTALLSHTINRLRSRFKAVMSFDCRRAVLAPETILLELHRYFEKQGKPQLQALIGQNVPPETLATEIAKLMMQWPLLVVFDNFESLIHDHREIANRDLQVFLATLVRVTASSSRFLFTTRYLFDIDDRRLGHIQELPLGDLSRAEALMLMQKLPNLAQATYREKLDVLEKFGGHPYALVTLDRHCSHRSLDKALQDTSLLKSELREFLAIELNYRRLSNQARELLNLLAAFRIGIPFKAIAWLTAGRAAESKVLKTTWSDLLNKGISTGKEVLLRILGYLPKIRRTGSVHDCLGELIDWGLLTPLAEDAESQSLSISGLLRDFCRDQQPPKIWNQRLRDAATFYTHQTQHLSEYNKTEVAVWSELEAFELLIESKDFAPAASLLLNLEPILCRWGYGRYLEIQYKRLLDKLDPHGVANIRHCLGILMLDRGDYEAALQQYHLSLKIVEELDIQGEVGRLLHEIAMTHQLRGKFDEAIQHYQRSLKIKEKLGDRAGAIGSLHNLGAIYQERGDYEAALQQYERSLKAAEELDDREAWARSSGQIGILYRVRGQYEAAIQQYNRALKVFEGLNDYGGVANLLHEIGNIHNLRGDSERAINLYQQSLKIKEALGDRLGIGTTLAQIGQLFTNTGHYSEAFKYLLAALELFVQLQSQQVRLTANNLRSLRADWGKWEFDAAWRNATNIEIPDWLIDDLEATSP